MGKELYVNRKEFEKFIQDRYPLILINSQEERLSSYPIDLIEELHQCKLIKARTRKDADNDKYSVSLVVKALILSTFDNGIYLIDEQYGTGVDKISIPGGHLEELDNGDCAITNNDIKNELCRELAEELTKSDKIIYSKERCLGQNIVEDTLLNLGVDRIRALESIHPYPTITTFCHYISGESLIIYIPLITDIINNPNFIKFSKSDFESILSLYYTHGRVPGKQVKRMFPDIATDDVRIRHFETMLLPIFNSYKYIKYCFDYDVI